MRLWHCIGLPNFVQIKPLWRSYDVISIVQDGGVAVMAWHVAIQAEVISTYQKSHMASDAILDL